MNNARAHVDDNLDVFFFRSIVAHTKYSTHKKKKSTGYARQMLQTTLGNDLRATHGDTHRFLVRTHLFNKLGMFYIESEFTDHISSDGHESVGSYNV